MQTIYEVKRENWVIWGGNRVERDFRYIFDWISVERTISGDLEISDELRGKLILCDFDKSKKEEVLIEKGFIRGLDYYFEEDFFCLLDEIVLPEDRDIVIWGTGKMAHLLHDECGEVVPKFYIDNNKNIDAFCGIEVVHPEQINNWNNMYIIIAVDRKDSICQQIESKGLKVNDDYISYQKLISMPSRMLKKTIFNEIHYNLTCNTMLNHLEILHRGDTRCCCTVFVKENLDNIFDKGIYELWHSNIHKIMCLSIVNKTYTFCDKSMCPLFVGASSSVTEYIEEEYNKMTEYPEVLEIGHDYTCNLACSTCRDCTTVAKGTELEIIKRIGEKVKEEYLEHCKFIVMAGDGEVFMSKSYREIYTDPRCKPKYFRLLSNGTLFDEKHWVELTKDKNCKYMLTVSIDAATKETYEKIRKNGNFEQLKQNMEYASKLRKRGELRYFRLNFVVQKENYKEMVPFVQWGESLGVDEIFFTKILNWGTYTKDQFKEISMMEEDGITPKDELIKVMNNPIIKKSEIVDLGTIQYNHKEDNVDIVNNYYKWELEKRGGKIFD